MHSILLLRNVHLVVRVVDCWSNFILDLAEGFLVIDQLLLLFVEIILDLLDFIEFLCHFVFHLRNIALQIAYFLRKYGGTSAVLFSVFSKALRLFNLISYSALA